MGFNKVPWRGTVCTAKWIYKDELFLINLLSLIARTELQLENFLLKLNFCAVVHQTTTNYSLESCMFTNFVIQTNLFHIPFCKIVKIILSSRDFKGFFFFFFFFWSYMNIPARLQNPNHLYLQVICYHQYTKIWPNWALFSICDPTPANEALCGKINFAFWAKM